MEQSRKLTPAEWTLFWSALCSPLIGAIPATIAFTKGDKRYHIWWTWVSAVISFFMVVSCWEHYPVGALAISWIWGVAVYWVQRYTISRPNNIRVRFDIVAMSALISVIVSILDLTTVSRVISSNESILTTFVYVGGFIALVVLGIVRWRKKWRWVWFASAAASLVIGFASLLIASLH